MFQGFDEKTGEFFWELCFNNDRAWFYDHKEQFETLIGTPVKELAKETAALMNARYPKLELQVHVSRIWRDARRLFGRGPLKESMWFSMKCASRGDHGASFYFELKPATFCYGMGFWSATAEQSGKFRKKVDANPAEFARIAGEVAALKGYELEGPLYSRPKGDHGALINAWYNRKWADLNHMEDLGGVAYSKELPSVLADAYTELMPMFRYLSVL